MTDSLTQRFLKLGAATVYEASGQKGAMSPDIKPISSGTALCGRAFTVWCHAGDNLGLHCAVALAEPGMVLVVNMDGDVESGVWGEVLTAAAQAKGIAGLVIEGSVRDVAAIRSRNFPVFCKGVSVKGTLKETFRSIGSPVVCGGVLVRPGDVIVADDDGVVVVQQEDAAEVVALAEKRRQKEVQQMSVINEGTLTIDLLGLRHKFEDLCRESGIGMDLGGGREA